MGLSRSSFRYQLAPKDNEEELRLAMIKLAKRYGRYGYRKIAALLRMEGWTVITRVGSKYIIQTDEKSTRNTQLYRTIIHEVGHWVDYLEKVERPEANGVESYAVLNDRYFSRPRQEREAFAHRYADELGDKLKKFGLIPFDRIDD